MSMLQLLQEEMKELPKFIMLVGIPGSGKSTWIQKEKMKDKYIVVSPDDMRRDTTGDVSDVSQDKAVWVSVKNKVSNALRDGNNVILDATNVNSKRRIDFVQGLPKSKLMAKVFYVDPEVSKKRIKDDIDNGIDRSNVPPEVVDKMYDDFLKSVKVNTAGKIIDTSPLEDEGFKIID